MTPIPHIPKPGTYVGLEHITLDRSYRSLADLYSREELNHIFAENPDASAEFDESFLGFPYVYKHVADHADNWLNIIDAGGCLGLQARLFRGFESYTIVERENCRYKNFVEMGFHASGLGCSSVRMAAQDYLRDLALVADTLDDQLVIISAVPDWEVYRVAYNYFPNVIAWYPGEGCVVKGDWHVR